MAGSATLPISPCTQSFPPRPEKVQYPVWVSGCQHTHTNVATLLSACDMKDISLQLGGVDDK